MITDLRALSVALLCFAFLVPSCFLPIGVRPASGEEDGSPSFEENCRARLFYWDSVGDTICVSASDHARFFLFNRKTQEVTPIRKDAYRVTGTRRFFVIQAETQGKGTQCIDVIEPSGKLVRSSGDFVPVVPSKEEDEAHFNDLGVFEFGKSVICGLKKDTCVIPLRSDGKIQHFPVPAWETAVCNDKLLWLTTGKLEVFYDDSGSELSVFPCKWQGSLRQMDSVNSTIFFAITIEDKNYTLTHVITPISHQGEIFGARKFTPSYLRRAVLLDGACWFPLLLMSPDGGPNPFNKFILEKREWAALSGLVDTDDMPSPFGVSAFVFGRGQSVLVLDPKTESTRVLMTLDKRNWLHVGYSRASLPEDLIVVGEFAPDTADRTFSYFGRGVSGLAKVVEADKESEGRK